MHYDQDQDPEKHTVIYIHEGEATQTQCDTLEEAAEWLLDQYRLHEDDTTDDDWHCLWADSRLGAQEPCTRDNPHRGCDATNEPPTHGTPMEQPRDLGGDLG